MDKKRVKVRTVTKVMLSLLGCGVLSHAMAMHIQPVVDNESVSATISSLDITRLAVQGDRIKSLKGVRGAYTRENDEKNGEIYLQPTALSQHAALTVLVETEQGRHFTLLLTPVAVPGDTLLLVPQGVNRLTAARFEQASDYEITLSRLVRAMARHSTPEGYTMTELDDPTNRKNKQNQKTYAIGHQAVLHLKTLYQGLHFQGQIYSLTNTCSTPIELDERAFYKQGTRAVSLESVTVAPKSTIQVMRVVSHA